MPFYKLLEVESRYSPAPPNDSEVLHQSTVGRTAPCKDGLPLAAPVVFGGSMGTSSAGQTVAPSCDSF